MSKAKLSRADRNSSLGQLIGERMKGCEGIRGHDLSSILDGIDLCESPIEKDLFVALLFADWPAGRFPSVVQTVPFEVARLVTKISPTVGVIISPQAKWQKYRFDFAVHLVAGSKPLFFAVECDGHDFHERTPDQAPNGIAAEIAHARWLE